MKPRPLPRLAPLRATIAPWERGELPRPDGEATGPRSCLPPTRRPRQAAEVPIETMPTTITFALVDVVAEATGRSKNQMRKAILRGRVEVNGTIVRDPDMRVGGQDLVRVDRSVPVRAQ